MSFVACWLNDREVVAEEEFDDLLTAQEHVLRCLAESGECLGATSIEVRDEHWVYFAVRPGGEGLLPSA